MRIRFAIVVLALLMGLVPMAGVLAQDDATPSAEEETSAPQASPVAEPIRVITMVMWYQPSASGDVVEIGPVGTNDQHIAGPGDPAAGVTGEINFASPDNDDLPRITIGDSVFDAYAPLEDPTQIFRWVYFDGDPAVRPATMVLQVRATAGPYENAEGIATFSSRSDPGSGVVVIMLNPPEEAE